METKRILIVGGVAGGASAAARARRLSEEAEIILFERGEYISFANCGLPYYIGGTIKERELLLIQTPEKMRQRFNIDVRINTEVVAIDREKKQLTVKHDDKEYNEKYDELILSPGAAAIKPPLPGIDDPRIFTLRTIPDMDKINDFITSKQAKKAVVIGGGYIGLEMAENLRERGIEVTIVELLPQTMAPIDPEMAAILQQELILNSVELKLGISVTEFGNENNKLQVKLSNDSSIGTDMAILAIGVKPENKLAKQAGLTIGERGGIVVNDQMQTSDPHIYAVGDAIEITEFVSNTKTQIPLAGPANRQGRIAADNIFNRKSSYKNTQGTGVCKIFNQTVAMTGLNEKTLQKLNFNYEKIYLHQKANASYYPNATPIHLKLLFDPANGKILGAQAIGRNGIARRIDILALALRNNLTVVDLAESELCYAPPYGSAKDIINYAGFVTTNIINGEMKICHVEDVLNLKPTQLLLDVRTPAEFNAGTIPNSIHIPVDELRNRLTELPRSKELLVFCKVGIRGYLACRILQQNKFNCRNLSGGYTTYQFSVKKCTAVNSTLHTRHTEPTSTVDARGLACPGPIQKLQQTLTTLKDGENLTIITTDPGFINDAPAWCHTTGHEFLGTTMKNGDYYTTIRKLGTPGQPVTTSDKRNLTIVAFSNDLDKALAAFIIANGAATMNYNVTIFFTFWGLNILRKNKKTRVKKTFIERMFGFMMPRGANKLALSKLSMLGAGTTMIKNIMHKKHVSSLPELIDSAKHAGVKLVACNMTMDLMGIKKEELIDGVEQGGVAMYLDHAGQGNINLFI